jgi:opacity protein-like surface antigen
MKKIAIASLIALAATAASALEVGVTTTTEYSASDKRSGHGFSVGQSFGKFSASTGFERFQKGGNDQDRFTVVGGYDVTKLGSVTVTPKLGVAYLKNQTTESGYALSVGVGASMPVTKKIALTLDAARQYGQDRVQSYDGNTVTAGLKYTF